MAKRMRLPLIVLALAIAPGLAQAAKDPAKRLQQMLRKVEQEKAQLARENEQLTQQSGAAAAQLKQLQEELAASQRRAGGLATKTSALEKEIEAVRAEREAFAAKLAATEKLRAEMAAKLADTEAERRRLAVLGQHQQQTLETCRDHNGKLYAYGNELLEQYRRKSCGDALLQFEPVTGLKRVEVENLLEDYGDRLDAERLPQAAKASAARTGD